jgi:hypothetical protein
MENFERKNSEKIVMNDVGKTNAEILSEYFGDTIIPKRMCYGYSPFATPTCYYNVEFYVYRTTKSDKQFEESIQEAIAKRKAILNDKNTVELFRLAKRVSELENTIKEMKKPKLNAWERWKRGIN